MNVVSAYRWVVGTPELANEVSGGRRRLGKIVNGNGILN